MPEQKMNISKCIKEAIEDGTEAGFIFGYMTAAFGGADWPKIFAGCNETMKNWFSKAALEYKEFEKYKLMALAMNLQFRFDVYKAVEQREAAEES